MKRLSQVEIEKEMAIVPTAQDLTAETLKKHQHLMRPVRKLASDCPKDWMTDTRPRWNGRVVEPASKQNL